MAKRPTSPTPGFRGWPASALDFYAGLEATNTKAYWDAHREVYERDVKAPMLALAAAVEAEFGPLKLFRPHRDVRFSKDKTPYKTQCGAVGETEGGSIVYVAIGAEGLFTGAGYYGMANDQLQRFRAAIADETTGAELMDLVAAVRAQGYELMSMGELKTAPRGYPKDHPRVELLRRKGLAAGRSFPPAAWLHTAKALDRITASWRSAAPLNAWLDTHVGPSQEMPEGFDAW